MERHFLKSFWRPFSGKKYVLFFFLLTAVLSCSSGPSLDPRLQEALNKLAQNNVNGAYKLVSEVLKENPEHCEAHLVRELVGFQGIIQELDKLMDLFSATQTALYPSQLSQIVDVILRELLNPIEEYAQEMFSSSEVVWEKGCRVYVEDFPVSLRVGDTVSLDVHLRGLMGRLESIVFSLLSGGILSALDFVFSHNLSVNLSSVFELADLVRTDRFVYLLRSLGNFMELNPQFLSWNPDPAERDRFLQIPGRLASMLEKLSHLPEVLAEEGENKKSFVRFYDNDRNRTLSWQDVVEINFDGSVEVFATPYTVQPYSFEIPLWVTPELVDEAESLLARMSMHLNGDPSEALSWFHISEINAFLVAMGQEAIPDIIAVQPLALFKGPSGPEGFPDPPQPKPLRQLVPYWYSDPFLGGTSFMIEAEIKDDPRFIGDFYIDPGDVPHFPDEISFYGEKLTGLSIPFDCVTVSESMPDYFTLLYIGFQDPTFNGAVKVNLQPITKVDECYEIDSRSYYQGFNFPDLYSFNKVGAFLSLKLGSYIIPGLDYLFQQSQDLGGMFDYSSTLLRLFYLPASTIR